MIAKTRLLRNWDPKTYRNLRHATFDYGMLRHVMKKRPESRTFVVFANKQVMGWALAFLHKKEVNLHMFVNERYRGRGISRVLVKKALEYYPKVRLAIHDRITKKIFTKLETEFPKRVETYRWWKVNVFYRNLLGVKI